MHTEDLLDFLNVLEERIGALEEDVGLLIEADDEDFEDEVVTYEQVAEVVY